MLLDEQHCYECLFVYTSIDLFLVFHFGSWLREQRAVLPFDDPLHQRLLSWNPREKAVDSEQKPVCCRCRACLQRAARLGSLPILGPWRALCAGGDGTACERSIRCWISDSSSITTLFLTMDDKRGEWVSDSALMAVDSLARRCC